MNRPGVGMPAVEQWIDENVGRDCDRGRRDEHKYCVYCGRELVDVEELDSVYDRSTGERRTVVWRQCPKYPRNGLMALFAGTHESFQRHNTIHGRRFA